MDNFIQRRTTLDLNGPTLSWLTEPTGVTTCGIGTFIGIATATFPVGLPASYATNTGSLSYQWWYELAGTNAPTQGKITNGSMSGLGLTGITGAATTTLTVYGTSTTFELNGTPTTSEGLKFFLKPDYVPSAYGTGDPITAGSARSTGNAINEGVVNPSSPWGASGWPSLYTVDSTKADFIINPTIQITTQPATQTIPATTSASEQGTATFNVVGLVTGHGSESLSYQWEANGSVLNNGETSYNITVPADPVNEPIPGWDGGNSGRGNDIYYDTTDWPSDYWKSVNFNAWEESGIYHKLRIDGIRTFEENGNWQLGVLGGRVYKCRPMSSPANLFIGGDTPAGGGNRRLVIEEGGDDWNDMLLEVSDGFFRKITSQPVISSGPQTQTVTLTDRVEGANTPTLKLSTATAGIQTVTCKISHAIACNSPLSSDTVNLNVITAREVIKYERMNEEFLGSWYFGSEVNLKDESLTFATEGVRNKLICFYAPEKDIVAHIELAGAAGRDNSISNKEAGRGAVSSFYMTIKQNVEYVVKIGSSVSPVGDKGGGGGGSYIYEGGTLIAAVGGGGAAGENFKGGDGGGIGIAGEPGPGGGAYAGAGGPTFPDGQLPLQGYAPGGTWLFNPGIERTGGRVSGCTFGSYWLSQGYSACENMGYVKFRSQNGSIITESTDSILRGYKGGPISHRGNGGQTADPKLGGGGGGAHGGDAASGAGAGGGGGSGYQNGDLNTVVQLAPSTSYNGYIVFNKL